MLNGDVVVSKIVSVPTFVSSVITLTGLITILVYMVKWVLEGSTYTGIGICEVNNTDVKRVTDNDDSDMDEEYISAAEVVISISFDTIDDVGDRNIGDIDVGSNFIDDVGATLTTVDDAELKENM